MSLVGNERAPHRVKSGLVQDRMFAVLDELPSRRRASKANGRRLDLSALM